MNKSSYLRYLLTPEWRSLADQAKERDHYRCVYCGSPDELEVHHKTYKRVGHEELDDLITLCHRCHGIVTMAGRIGKFLGLKGK